MKLILSLSAQLRPFVDFYDNNLLYAKEKANRAYGIFWLVSLLLLSNNLFADIRVQHVIHPKDGNCNGYIILEVHGDAGPFDVDVFWNGAPFTSVMDANGVLNFSELCAGNYDIKVTDDFGCVKNLSRTLSSCSLMRFDRHKADFIYPACESNNGAIRVFEECFTGVVPPLTYKWQNGETSNQIFGLTAGTHKLTVTDNNNCIGVFHIELMSESDPNASVQDIEGCNSPAINTEGVSGPFNFYWSDGYTCNAEYGCGREELPAGDYSVTVFHVNDGVDSECAEIFNFSYNEDYTEPYGFNIFNIVATCENDFNGSFEFEILGGMPPFLISLASTSINGSYTCIGNEHNDIIDSHFGKITGLCPGNITLWVKQKCSDSSFASSNLSDFDHNVPEIPTPDLQLATDIFLDCDGEGENLVFQDDNSSNLTWKLYKDGVFFSQGNGPGGLIELEELNEGQYNLIASYSNGCQDEYAFEIENGAPQSELLLPIEINLWTNNPEASWQNDEPIYIFLSSCESRTISPEFFNHYNSPLTYKWNLKETGETVSTEKELVNAQYAEYILEVFDECGRTTTKEIDFRCNCSPDFRLNVKNPCNPPFFGDTKAELIPISPQLGLNYNILWEWDGLQNDWEDEVERERWNSTEAEFITDGKFNFNDGQWGHVKAYISDENGCSYILEYEVDPPIGSNEKKLVLPVKSSKTPPSNVLELIRQDAQIPPDVFSEVFAYCGKTKKCGDFVSGDVENPKLIQFVPYPGTGNPCQRGGYIICPQDENTFKPVPQNFVGIKIETASRCGCYWPPGVIESASGDFDGNIGGVYAENCEPPTNDPNDDDYTDGPSITIDLNSAANCVGEISESVQFGCRMVLTCRDENSGLVVLHVGPSEEYECYHKSEGVPIGYEIWKCCPLNGFGRRIETLPVGVSPAPSMEKCQCILNPEFNPSVVESIFNTENLNVLNETPTPNISQNSLNINSEEVLKNDVIQNSETVRVHKNSIKFSIFPNPTSESANIHLKGLDKKVYSLLIHSGEGLLKNEIKYSNIEQGNRNVVLKNYGSDLPPGVYFISIIEDGKILQTKKFIKLN